jgi:hypothetical protein
MTEYKKLGGSSPTKDTTVEVYTPPTSRSAVVRSMLITNNSDTADTVELLITDSEPQVVIDYSSYAGIFANDTNDYAYGLYFEEGDAYNQGTGYPTVSGLTSYGDGRLYFRTSDQSQFAINPKNAKIGGGRRGFTQAEVVEKGGRVLPTQDAAAKIEDLVGDIATQVIYGFTFAHGYWWSTTQDGAVYKLLDDFFPADNALFYPTEVTTGLTETDLLMAFGPDKYVYNPITDQYGSGTLVLVSAAGTGAYYSTDEGQTWTTTSLPSTTGVGTIQELIYSEYLGKFFAVRSADNVNNNATALDQSTDGITWTRYTIPTGTIAYDANSITSTKSFLAIEGETPQIGLSTDGITWTSGTTPGTAVGSNIETYLQDYIVVLPYSYSGGNLALSTDGTTWTYSSSFGRNASWKNLIGYHSVKSQFYNKDYIVSKTIQPRETITITGGYTLSEDNGVYFKSQNGTSAVNIFGGEI